MMHRPAYAPEYFADRRIKFTIPYTMPGELTIAASAQGVQFPAEQFLHNVDKPFEIWRMTARVRGLITVDDEQVLIDPQPTTMEERIRLSVVDISKNEQLTKNPTLISAMQKLNERTWEWDPRPYTIVRQEGLRVTADALAFPTICFPDLFNAQDPACDLVPTDVTHARVEVTFQGWLLIIEPPSESR